MKRETEHPLLLAIDTSTGNASVALFRNGAVIAEISWQAGQNHTTQLVPFLAWLLESQKVTLEDMDGLVVAKGPGSFNGLRVGMATAKGFALALDIPLVGISTLEVEAYAYQNSSLPLCPIHDAGRGELASALFQRRKGRWTRLEEEHITSLEGLLNTIRRRTIFCGEVPPWAKPTLERELGDKALIVEAAGAMRRAGFLAELGWMRLARGERDDPATIQPLYLRRPPVHERESQK